MKQIITTLIVIIGTNIFAQFGNIGNRIANRVANKIEDRIVDKVAEELLKRAYKPVDEAVENAMREAFKDSVGEVDFNKSGKAYGEFLAGLNEAQEGKLQAKYTFDLILDVESTDNKGKPQPMKMMYMKSGQALGMQTADKKSTNTLVYDVANGVMVMYTEEKGKKSGQMLPNVMNIAGSLAKNKMEQEAATLKISKNGKSKTVAGYNCIGYDMETKDMKNEIYVTENFPINYMQAYSVFMQKFTPSAYIEKTGDWSKGFVFYSKSMDAKGKDINTWQVVNVSQVSQSFAKADYKFNAE